MEDLEVVVTETQQRNELTSIKKILMGLHQEIDCAGMSGVAPIKKLVAGLWR